MEQPEYLEGEQILLREAGELLGLSRKGVQNLVNRQLLRSEVRITPAGTKYGIVFRAEVLRLAANRRTQAAHADVKRGRGRPLKLPEAAAVERKPEGREGAASSSKEIWRQHVREAGDE